jgi:hypothetical protein
MLWLRLRCRYSTANTNITQTSRLITTGTGLHASSFRGECGPPISPLSNDGPGGNGDGTLEIPEPLAHSQEDFELQSSGTLVVVQTVPITLLNSDYKVFTKALSLRLAQAAPSVIHENQAGFMPGRSITEQTRLT